MSEWITDRRPSADHSMVWNARGVPTFPELVKDGEPWKPIPKCEPYVKPNRYKVVQFDNAEWGVLRVADDQYVAHSISWNTRQAAEEIKAIYERIAP